MWDTMFNHGPCLKCGTDILKPHSATCHAYKYCSVQCHSDHKLKGNPSRNYKNGKTMDNGYVMVHVGNNVYLKEHRLVAESFYGDISGKVVHHKNGDRKDNRPENLEVMERGKHTTLHTKGIKKPPSMGGKMRAISKLSYKQRAINHKGQFMPMKAD